MRAAGEVSPDGATVAQCLKLKTLRTTRA